MDRIRVPSWILWVMCALSLAIAGAVTWHDGRDGPVAWMVCGVLAGVLAFLGVMANYQDRVERRIIARFHLGVYLAHWIYPGASVRGRGERNEAYIGPEGALYDGRFTCWKSVTAVLLNAEFVPGPPPVLEVTYQLGGAIADAVDVMDDARGALVRRSRSERRLRIPVPAGREAEARQVSDVLNGKALPAVHRVTD